MSLKRFLLELNRDLDLIKSGVSEAVSFCELHGYTWFESDAALSDVEIAILTLEDRRFFRHFGVELRAFPIVRHDQLESLGFPTGLNSDSY